MGISSKDFLAQVNAIASEGPKYRLGGYGRDGTCDCIGLTIGAIRRAGGTWTGTHGSNYAARYQLVKLVRTSADAVYPGMQVLKAREKGDPKWKLPGRYAGHSDQRDYYHAGVVTSVNPLRITHSTGTGLPSSIRVDTVLGAWGWGGELKKVKYDGGILDSGASGAADTGSGSGDGAQAAVKTAVVATQNGKPLHLRAQPTKTCGLYWDAPNGAVVEVLEVDTGSDGWWRVKYNGFTGYCWNCYLAVG